MADALSRRADYEQEAKAEAEAEAKAEAEAGRDGQTQQRLTLRLAAAEEKEAEDGGGLTILLPVSLLTDMRTAAQADPEYKEQLDRLNADDGLERREGLLYTSEGIVYVPHSRELQRRLLEEAHDASGHSATKKTLLRLQAHCWWPRMRKDVEDYCQSCVGCAANKSDTQLPAGKLRPLPIPHRPWEVIGLDFVGPLPKSKGKDFIMTVVDKFSKMAQYVATTTEVTAKETARLLLEVLMAQGVGLPEAIISDRDPRFTAGVWGQLWKALGTKLKMSTAYHPQTDGQTERVNRSMQTALRIYASKHKADWTEWLATVAAAYNSTVHESTGKTPFEMNGRLWTDPMTLALRDPKMAEVTAQEAEDLLTGMRAVWEEARQVMIRQREKQRKYADKLRREEKYEVGDRVMLTTKNLSLHKGKLSDKWVGPFKVIEVMPNGVNVRLELSDDYRRIDNLFHVSKLKRFQPSEIEWPNRVQEDRPPPVWVDGKQQWEVEKILGKREEEVMMEVKESGEDEMKEESKDDGAVEEERKEEAERPYNLRARGKEHRQRPPQRRRRPKMVKQTVVKYLVKWTGYPESEAEWRPADELMECQKLVDEYEWRQQEERGEDSVALQYSVVVRNRAEGRGVQCQLISVQ